MSRLADSYQEWGFKLKNTTLAMATAVIALGIAGCGSDDSSSDSSSAATITKEDFLTQGNEICAAGNEEINAAAESTFGSRQPKDADIETFVNETVIPAAETQAEGIRGLGAPAGEEDQVNEILDAVDQAIEDAKADPLSVTSQKTDPFTDANKLAADYGLTECGAS